MRQTQLFCTQLLCQNKPRSLSWLQARILLGHTLWPQTIPCSKPHLWRLVQLNSLLLTVRKSMNLSSRHTVKRVFRAIWGFFWWIRQLLSKLHAGLGAKEVSWECSPKYRAPCPGSIGLQFFPNLLPPLISQWSLFQSNLQQSCQWWVKDFLYWHLDNTQRLNADLCSKGSDFTCLYLLLSFGLNFNLICQCLFGLWPFWLRKGSFEGFDSFCSMPMMQNVV
jgi:hypothetical protein